MANNPYVNKVVKEGTTLIDISSDTVSPSSLAQGYTAHDASGAQITGTMTGGSMIIRDEEDEHGGVIRHITAGDVVQGTKTITENGTHDVAAYADAYVNVSTGSVTINPLSVTQNGTYTAPSGHAYSPVTVNVSGGVTPTPPTPEPWVRPSDWPDLSKMDVSGDNILYMTYYADEDRGFCDFIVNCTGNYTVDIGYISGTSFVTESSQDYSSATRCSLYFGTANGTYKVLRVTGIAIKQLVFTFSNLITIDDFNGYSGSQGVIDIVGKLSDCNHLFFNNMFNLINVEISNIELTGSISMFSNCYSLVSVNASGWNTSNVTSMNVMFNGCYSLACLDVSGWDTSNVTTMNAMFNNCCSLTYLDISGWNTSKVTDMTSMFNNCYSLSYLDASGWDTSNVTTMNSVFGNCNSLAYLDISGWNTSNVTNMGSMFNGCSSLTNLDVSDWNTSKVTSLGSMFTSCYSLTSLDVSGWNTSKVTNMNSVFVGCYSLTSLDVSGWDTSNVTTMTSMFSSCYSLTSLDVSDWNTSKVTNMYYMFNGCHALTNLDVSDWNTSNVTSMGRMFNNCYSLTSLDVSDWNTSNVTTMSNMLDGCYSLTHLDVSGWDTSKTTNMNSMFNNCIALPRLDVSNWDLSSITTANNTSSMFKSCKGLKGSLSLPSSMAFIGSYCFSDMSSIEEWHFAATTPPTLANSNAFSYMANFGGKKIYVPAASLSAYQTATNWSTYASYMVGE